MYSAKIIHYVDNIYEYKLPMTSIFYVTCYQKKYSKSVNHHSMHYDF